MRAELRAVSRGVVFACALCFAAPAHAQLAGSNLLLAQVGNWPPNFADRGTPSRQSFYDLLDLQWVTPNARVGLRFETDRNSDRLLEYEGLTQRFADWTAPGLHVRVGNFETILGRGLVHRSFELTGVVLEATGLRTRYAPARDVDGVLVELERGPLSLRALSGSPSDGSVSLAIERTFDQPRHNGQISGGQLVLSLPQGARVGTAYARASAGTDPSTGLPRAQETGSGFVEWDPATALHARELQLPLYFEYATQQRTFGEWWSFAREDRVPHALYGSANALWRAFTLSLEWKDYSQFRLGTNDPPSLVREHTALLLNRSTHVLVADREQGYQAELSWTPRPGWSATANLSRGDLARGGRFVEQFLELEARDAAADRWQVTAFVDRSADSAIAILKRVTLGTRVLWRPGERWSVTAELEHQRAHRKQFDFATLSIADRAFANRLVALNVARGDWGSVGFQYEGTTDDLDPSWDAGRSGTLHFLGWNASARIAEGHEASLFAGRRRGGLACTAGTCYEVTPFEGVELRLVSRF